MSSSNDAQTDGPIDGGIDLLDPVHDEPRIPLREFLDCHDQDRYTWDDDRRETDPRWINPLAEAGLDSIFLARHKVFKFDETQAHLEPPKPFFSRGPLGASTFATVYEVICNTTYRRPVALKVIRCVDKDTLGPESPARKKALNEVLQMSRLRHPHIVVYVASFENYSIKHRTERRRVNGKVKITVHQTISEHHLSIAMYPPAHCNLRDFMAWIVEDESGHDEEDGGDGQGEDIYQSQSFGSQTTWPVDSCRRERMHGFFYCLSRAVAYLVRRLHIRHKDIKPENVVIDYFGVPILTDFGISTHFDGTTHSQGFTAKTVKYAEPEATQEVARNTRSDIFPLGCVFLEMTTVLLGQQSEWPEMFQDNPDDSDTSSPRRDFQYSKSFDVDTYVRRLVEVAEELRRKKPSRAPSIDAVLGILPHVRRMMNLEYSQRPFAHQLHVLFKPLRDFCQEEYHLHCQDCDQESPESSGGLEDRIEEEAEDARRNDHGEENGHATPNKEALAETRTETGIAAVGNVLREEMRGAISYLSSLAPYQSRGS